MIELEIQALALQREGLLVEVGRLAGACGFSLLRQRLVTDPHGVLLTMVVRGPWLKKRSLRSALEGCDRLVSFELAPFVDGESKPHFAATRKVTSSYVPPPAPPPQPGPVPEPVAKPASPSVTTMVVADVVDIEATRAVPEQAGDEPIVHRRVPPPETTVPEVAVEPWVELPELEADVAVVDQALARLEQEYPRILPRLQALDRGVQPGARVASLHLAGQRVGAWLFEREYALDTGLTLAAALAAIAVPSLHAFAEAGLQGGQLHLQHSPLCAPGGHSGCSFFSGFLEGLLGPAIAPGGLSVLSVCCRSCGADECVFAVSE